LERKKKTEEKFVEEITFVEEKLFRASNIGENDDV